MSIKFSKGEIERVLKHVAYPGFKFSLIEKGACLFIVLDCPGGTNNATGGKMAWRSRKWYVSPYSTPSETVQTAFKAVLTALEHEAREKFRYHGQPVLGPHMDLDRVAETLMRSVRHHAST